MASACLYTVTQIIPISELCSNNVNAKKNEKEESEKNICGRQASNDVANSRYIAKLKMVVMLDDTEWNNDFVVVEMFYSMFCTRREKEKKKRGKCIQENGTLG